MRFFIALLVFVVAAFFGVQAYRLYNQRDDLRSQGSALDARASALIIENKQLDADRRYLSDPRNRMKELQTRFNYRKPDETLYLLSPANQ